MSVCSYRFTDKEHRAIRAARAEAQPYDVIAASLGRTAASIRAQAQKLGITGQRGGARKHDKPKVSRFPLRKCLHHGGPFRPSDRFDFVCEDCENSEFYRSAAWLP